jgi:CPA2 family monovalent cation:H+ antiporter-2
VVLDVLSRSKRMLTGSGRATFAVLLAQDLAVIPLLMFVAVLGTQTGLSIGQTIAIALAQVVAAVALIVVVGRIVLRPLFRLVAQAKSRELFIATTLFVIVATGVVAAAAGLSMALGAFVAGLLLAETEYRKAIEATIEPFKGLLLGIFFFTVGMTIDAREVLRAPLEVAVAVAGLIVIKGALAYGLARGFRLSRGAATETAALLAPGGEFAFVAIGVAAASGLLEPRVASFAVVVTALSMIAIPILGTFAQRTAARIEPAPPPDPALAVAPLEQRRHAIVVGHGRVGKTVCRLLAQHGVAYTAVDDDARAVSADRAEGLPVYYGRADDPAFLAACGLTEAASVVITTHTRAAIDRIVEVVRTVRPDIAIVSRAADAEHARHLYAIGVTDAVPETVEASLQLSEAALVGLGVPTGPVIASIHEERDVVRRTLQAAAEDAGRPAQRGIRERSRV